MPTLLPGNNNEIKLMVVRLFGYAALYNYLENRGRWGDGELKYLLLQRCLFSCLGLPLESVDPRRYRLVSICRVLKTVSHSGDESHCRI